MRLFHSHLQFYQLFSPSILKYKFDQPILTTWNCFHGSLFCRCYNSSINSLKNLLLLPGYGLVDQLYIAVSPSSILPQLA